MLREGKLSVFDLNLVEKDTIFNIISIVRAKLNRNTIFEGSLSHEYGKVLLWFLGRCLEMNRADVR